MVRLGTIKHWLCYRQPRADNTFHGLESLICVILKEDTQVRALGGVGIINVMEVTLLRIFVVDGDGPDDDQADRNHDCLLVVDEEDREDNSEVDSARHHPLLLLLFLPHPKINKLHLTIQWAWLVSKWVHAICNVWVWKMFLPPLPFLPLERPDLEILLHLTFVETQTSQIWKEKRSFFLNSLNSRGLHSKALHL